MKKKRIFIALLSVFAVSTATAALATGCAGSAGKIDAPTSRIEAELGTYVIPDYEVVDKNGMILAGYNVYLKSVKNAEGEELGENYGSAVTVDEAGVYSFVYSAGTRKVKDVTVSIDFADRTAPTINCDDSSMPKFFIKGNSYKVPQYTLSGDFDRSKCWTKVYYIDDDGKETEVKVDGGRFLVDKESGSYAVRVHVEDAVGNANDYEYTRKVDNPETFVEHKVLYLDEEFGEKQVSCYQSYYKGGFVAEGTEGAHIYEGEAGAYKVSFDGVTETTNNEGLLIMEVPAVIDLSDYEEIYLYVYNDSGNDIIMGSHWWNDTKVEAGKWTRLSWNTRAWGYNVSANSVKTIDLADITDMTIRFIFDYNQEIIPNGDFYLSAMYGTPKVKTEIECGDNVILNKTKYFINDTVELSAEYIEGKTVNYYMVDGEIIAGENFIATKENHTVEVHYVDGELTNDNMTWAEPDTFDNIQGTDGQWQTLGVSDYFVYTFDIYGAEEGWCYAGVQVGNNGSLLGFEISDAANSKFAGYGGLWKWQDGVKLSATQYNAIRNATSDNPVKAILVRRGAEIRAYLAYGDNLDFVASVDNTTLGITQNQYGYGQRNGPTNICHNVAIVESERKTAIYFEGFAATVTPDDSNVMFDGSKFYIGDSVMLRAAQAPEGKLFAYFEVNGKRIDGSNFLVTQANTTVKAVYTDVATITVENGVGIEDEKTVYGIGDSVTLTHEDVQGKIFDYYLIDGEIKLHTDVFVITAKSHNITAVYADSASEISWAEGGDEYDCEAVMGSAASSWKSWGFDGEVYGSSQYWAISVNVKHTTEWNSFEFIQGTTHSIRVRFHKDDYFGVMVHDNNKETYPSSEFVPAYPTKNAGMVTKLKAGVTITCVRNGGTITLYANGVQFFKTEYAIDHTGDWFGVGFVPGDGANKPQMTDTKFITGQAKVEAYLETLREFSEATSEAQVNNIFGAYAKDGSTCEFITTGVPAGLDDENVKEKGVLKVTAASDDVGLVAGSTFDTDASKYSEIYFWVYIESEEEEELKRVAGGAYWKDGGLIAKTNTWTKISFGADTIAQLDINGDLSNFTFRIYSQTWGSDPFTSINGKTVYVTSLYGVPKN